MDFIVPVFSRLSPDIYLELSFNILKCLYPEDLVSLQLVCSELYDLIKSYKTKLPTFTLNIRSHPYPASIHTLDIYVSNYSSRWYEKSLSELHYDHSMEEKPLDLLNLNYKLLRSATWQNVQITDSMVNLAFLDYYLGKFDMLIKVFNNVLTNF
jgi:hypothetical protein